MTLSDTKPTMVLLNFIGLREQSLFPEDWQKSLELGKNH